MAKNKPITSKDSRKKTKVKDATCSHANEIYLSEFHFQKKHDKQKISVKDMIITINSEMTPKQIEEVLSNRYYKIKALRSYFKSEGRVFNQDEALEKYVAVSVVFIKKVGVSFA